MAEQATFRIWRGDNGERQVRRLQHRSFERHGGAGCGAPAFRHAGQRSGGALELQGGQVRVVLGGNQRQAAADVHDAAESAAISTQPVTIEPMQHFPARQGSGDRRLLELPGQEEDQEVQAAQAGRPRRHLAHAAGRRRPRAGIPQVHRVFPVPGRVPRAARPSHARRVHRAAFLVYTAHWR